MSFYKGDRGEKIRRIWMAGSAGEKALRDWLAQNGYPEVSLTVFTYLSHYEPAREKFLHAHTATKRRKPSSGKSSKPAAGKSSPPVA